MELTWWHRSVALAMWLLLIVGLGLMTSMLRGWLYLLLIPLFPAEIAVGGALIIVALLGRFPHLRG